MLRYPTLMSAPQQQDLRLQPRRERLAGRSRDCCGMSGGRQAGSGCARGSSSGKSSMMTGPVLALQQPQRREDHPLLERRIARRAERPAQLERHPQRARRLGVLGLRPDKADRDRRDALFLEIVPQRAHGARAERSNGREDDGVDVVLL